MKHATDTVYGAGKRDADSHSSEARKLRPKEQASYPHYASRSEEQRKDAKKERPGPQKDAERRK